MMEKGSGRAGQKQPWPGTQGALDDKAQGKLPNPGSFFPGLRFLAPSSFVFLFSSLVVTGCRGLCIILDCPPNSGPVEN
jgi:hypothetical protein